MSELHPLLREHTRQIIESLFLQPIAQEIYRAKVKRHDALLAELDPVDRTPYFKAAALGVATVDLTNSDLFETALYDGANQMVDGTIAEVPRTSRITAVAIARRMFKAITESLCGDRPLQRDFFARVRSRDQAEKHRPITIEGPVPRLRM